MIFIILYFIIAIILGMFFELNWKYSFLSFLDLDGFSWNYDGGALFIMCLGWPVTIVVYFMYGVLTGIYHKIDTFIEKMIDKREEK